VKLLLVEDDAKVAAAVVRGLRAEGYTVEHAADGIDGLWLATEGSFDLIVLDVLLPGHDGYDVCARLRAAGDWTPILMLTALDGPRAETRGLDCGADDYLAKPFAFPVLLARIRALLRRAERTPPPSTVGELRLDSRRRRVWRGDDELTLTAREFAVLEYLVRRAGQVASKYDILAGVWEQDFDGDPNIVEVYVRRLRLKIGSRQLETVRGAGYRLGAG
jgi:two-component system OmpR family response regulator